MRPDIDRLALGDRTGQLRLDHPRNRLRLPESALEVKNIPVQETFEGLYPNFNELSIKDKIEALNKKKQLYKNTGNNISSKKYSNKFNKQSNKNTVSTRQKIEEKNNNLKNTLQSNDEYIEVNLSWKEKLINKINVIKRILKKQKALPENK